LTTRDARPAVFLDRDGTMIRDVGYLDRLEAVEWLPSTADAVRRLNHAGFLVCVTTNQSGIGRGLFTHELVAKVHAHMSATLEAAGARIDGWFYCPHHPDAALEGYRMTCDCRKPAPGMIWQARARFPIDLSRSYVIGDKQLDMDLATRSGTRGILVRTGSGRDLARTHGDQVPGAAHVADNLPDAVTWLLAESRG
jgi:D-glycero-D-manno-heptose 1,7-bisphosphate phosphatase